MMTPSPPSPVVAVVEDDAEIRALVAAHLGREGFEAVACPDGAALDRLRAERRVDAIVLDVMIPGEDGLSICRRIAAEGRIPIIIVSARGEDLDRIIGLEIGADDYLPKPFNPRELVARLRAVLRRAGPSTASVEPGSPAEVYRFNGWRLDASARTLTAPDGADVAVSNGELSLLVAFARHPRRVLSREQLLDWTRGPDAAPFDRAIDVQLSRLRRKLDDDPRAPTLIKTVRGDGYLFAADVRREKPP
jgi:two-component system OmpR family response regulator